MKRVAGWRNSAGRLPSKPVSAIVDATLNFVFMIWQVPIKEPKMNPDQLSNSGQT